MMRIKLLLYVKRIRGGFIRMKEQRVFYQFYESIKACFFLIVWCFMERKEYTPLTETEKEELILRYRLSLLETKSYCEGSLTYDELGPDEPPTVSTFPSDKSDKDLE